MTATATDMPPLSGEYELRLLRRGDPEFVGAIALVLTGSPEYTDEVRLHLANLESLAISQKLRLDLVVGAFDRAGLSSAGFAIESPGRTALVYTPSAVRRESEGRALCDVLVEVQRHTARRGACLVQALLPPGDRQRPPIHAKSGFRFLAELIYMERATVDNVPNFNSPQGLRFVTYLPKHRAAYLDALDATYRESLDCPGLTGLRGTADVLAGHMATGVYDPQGWFLALVDETPAGVVLTARVPGRDALEVVYMGVVPSARGNSVGNALLAEAVSFAEARGLGIVTLAVDSINEPARRLYHRWHFLETSRRRAWISTLGASV